MSTSPAQQLNGWQLGSTSVRFETAGKGVLAISSGKGDLGGASYGAYQLSTTTGSLRRYLDSQQHGAYGRHFTGLQPGTDAFNARWLELARTDPAFARSQHQYIHDTHYEVQLQRLSSAGFDFSRRGVAIQDLVWSTSVQFGGATTLVQDALRQRYGSAAAVAGLSDADIIRTVQDYKAAHNESLFRRSSDAVRAGTLTRASAEKVKLLELAGLEAQLRDPPLVDNVAGGGSGAGVGGVGAQGLKPTENTTGITMCSHADPDIDVGYNWCIVSDGSGVRQVGLQDNRQGVLLTSVRTLSDLAKADAQMYALFESGDVEGGIFGMWADWSTAQLLKSALSLDRSAILNADTPLGAYYETSSGAHALALDKDNAVIPASAWMHLQTAVTPQMLDEQQVLGLLPTDWWGIDSDQQVDRLRNENPGFWIDSTALVVWTPKQVVLTLDASAQLGTTGDDRFDARYYDIPDLRYHDLSRIRRFYGGAGHDYVGASPREDTVLGGSGQDTLCGYDGHDLLSGESGNDLLFGGDGCDLLVGGLGNDELQGGNAADTLAGQAGNDRLFGQVGNDALYGGEGDDLLVGYRGINEIPQLLASGQSDHDSLWGGTGADTLLGGLGDDWLDGGSGADLMEGGEGDDRYVVNTINDLIMERRNQGHDTVFSTVSVLLSSAVEDLYLLEGYAIHGTGNAQDNCITGNSADNLLDGVTGKDTLIGGGGNDTYTVDSIDDVIVEQSGGGVDTVQSTVSYRLGAEQENLTLLDFSKPEKGRIDGVDVLVYGYPKAFELDYMQGNARPDFRGTCALTTIANVAVQSGISLTEEAVLETAIQNRLCVTGAFFPADLRGSATVGQQRSLLDSYGLRNGLLSGYCEREMANLVQSGRGVMAGVNAGRLWDDPAYLQGGRINHVITVTGVVRQAESGDLSGFYIADSGRGLVSDMTRYVPLEQFRSACSASNAYALYTIEPLKLWSENLDATGNDGNNILLGNRGNNVLAGGRGNDTIKGMAGSDIFVYARGDGRDILFDNDATPGNVDTLQFTDVKQTQLWFRRLQNDLHINVLGGAQGAPQGVTVRNWYVPGAGGGDFQLERIRTSDGLVMHNTDVDRLVQSMAQFAPPRLTQTEWVPGSVSNGQTLLTVTH